MQRDSFDYGEACGKHSGTGSTEYMVALIWKSRTILSVNALLLFSGARVAAEDAPSAYPEDIVVRNHSSTTEVEALRRFDPDELRSMGISSIADMIRRLGSQLKGPDGTSPVYAINGRRPLDANEVNTLPFDGIQSIELLPQEAAPRLGYPPNQPVLNFTTKAKFQGFEAMGSGQISTDGGGGTLDSSIGMTRLRGKDRLSITAYVTQQAELRQEDRQLGPDPAIVRNVTGIGGAEIDPLLGDLAGTVISNAAIPRSLDERKTFAAYKLGANPPNVIGLGSYRSLRPRQRTTKLSGFLSRPLGDDVTGMLSFSVERRRNWALQGLTTASIVVPTGDAVSPFGTDVVTNRYLNELPVLEQTGSDDTLHAGAGVVGSVSGWNWTLRLNHDMIRNRTDSDLRFDTIGNHQAAGIGDNAFLPIASGGTGSVVRDRARSTVRTTEAELVVNGMSANLPAGPITLTTTLSAQVSGTDSASLAYSYGNVSLNRDQGGGSVTASIPIASAAYEVLPFLGRLSAELSARADTVSRHGVLLAGHLGLSWAPAKRLQLLATLKYAETAPALSLIGAARIASPNTPFVDLISGESLFVTSISGGNPDLLAERRRTLTLTANLSPFKTDAVRTSLIYEDAAIRDQASSFSVLSPAIAAAYPDRFVRDDTGKLVNVDLSPVNLYRERQRTLKATLSYSGSLRSQPQTSAHNAQPKAIYLSASLTPTLNLEDLLWLAPGTTPLNLLNGDNINAIGGPSRWGAQADLSLSRDGLGVYLQSIWHSGSRVRNREPSADLSFAPLGTTNLTVYTDLERLVPNERWAKKLMIDIMVLNIANVRPRVRDRLGSTPIAYEPAYLDPLGRAVTLRMFKRF